MNFLVAPNALKGSLSAVEAARVIRDALNDLLPGSRCVTCPIADGGDGTLDALIYSSKGRIFSSKVHGPLPSMEVTARWGMMGDGTTAVIEMAEAAGLRLLRPDQYDVMKGTTAGVGELMLEAVQRGAQKILVGLGGSATNDGGAGCARALGAKFLDRGRNELQEGGECLPQLDLIEFRGSALGSKNVEVVALSDVTNPLCGPEGAAFTFAAQKGASPDQIPILDNALKNYAYIIERDVHRRVAELPGSGAAGGLGAGLIAFCDAAIESGIDYVLDLAGFDALLRECDIVITAEGMIDAQTLRGKGIEGVARRARKFNKPVYAFAGKIDGDAHLLQSRLHIHLVHQISPEGMTADESMTRAGSLLAGSIKHVFSSLHS